MIEHLGMAGHDGAQRTILGALLAAHPRSLDLDELDDQLGADPRVHEARRVLVRDGLATQLIA